MSNNVFYFGVVFILALVYFNIFQSEKIEPFVINGNTYLKTKIEFFNKANYDFINYNIQIDKAILLKSEIASENEKVRTKPFQGNLEILVPIQKINEYNNIKTKFKDMDDQEKLNRNTHWENEHKLLLKWMGYACWVLAFGFIIYIGNQFSRGLLMD